MIVDEIHNVDSDLVKVLIPAARARQRRRWRRSGLVAAAVLILTLGAALVITSGGGHHGTAAHSGQPGPSAAVMSGVEPKAPASLATGPDGTLYLIDAGRDQILHYTAEGGFRVLVGDGHRGFSSAGSAAHAPLDLTWSSGLAVSPRGVVYFTESGRVMRLGSNGTISVVAGGGRMPLSHQTIAANHAEFGTGGYGLAGLTFGPDGQLYVATPAGVYRITASTLQWVVGTPLRASRLPAHFESLEQTPAAQIDFAPATYLAFDRAGDLFVSSGNCYCLYEKTARGELRFIETLRAQGGSPGALAATDDGTVVAASGRGLQTISEGTPTELRATWPRTPSHQFPFDPGFGNGVAVGSNGQVYVDTDAGDDVPNQGLLEVSPTTHRARWLWAQPGSAR